MATISVYQQYFKAECLFNSKERHGVSVLLVSESEREKELLDGLRPVAEELAAEINGVIDWEHPLTSARTD